MAVQRAGYAQGYTRDMLDAAFAQQSANSHLHKHVFTAQNSCIDHYTCQSKHQSRTRMFSSSHSWHGSKPCHWFQQSPIAPHDNLWYIWVLTSVSAQQTSPHAHKSHQGCPARWLRLCIEKASQNRSQCSSQLVSVGFPWVQRPAVVRS